MDKEDEEDEEDGERLPAVCCLSDSRDGGTEWEEEKELGVLASRSLSLSSKSSGAY